MSLLIEIILYNCSIFLLHFVLHNLSYHVIRAGRFAIKRLILSEFLRLYLWSVCGAPCIENLRTFLVHCETATIYSDATNYVCVAQLDLCVRFMRDSTNPERYTDTCMYSGRLRIIKGNYARMRVHACIVTYIWDSIINRKLVYGAFSQLQRNAVALSFLTRYASCEYTSSLEILISYGMSVA